MFVIVHYVYTCTGHEGGGLLDYCQSWWLAWTQASLGFFPFAAAIIDQKPYDLGEHLANYGLLYLAATTHGGHSEIFRDSMKEPCIRPPLCIGRRYGIGKRRHETWKKHMQASASLYHTTLKISFPLLHSFLLSSLLLSSSQIQCLF